MDGVVRAPSPFSMTFGVLPSITATQEFVVPKSIPMTVPFTFLLKKGNIYKFRLSTMNWKTCDIVGDARGESRWTRRRKGCRKAYLQSSGGNRFLMEPRLKDRENFREGFPNQHFLCLCPYYQEMLPPPYHVNIKVLRK